MLFKPIAKTRGRRVLVSAAMVITIALLAWAAAQDRLHPTAQRGQAQVMTRLLAQYYSQAQLAAGSYVGSEFCLACHSSINHDTPDWRDTKHAFFIRRPMGMYSLKVGQGVTANSLGAAKDDFITGLDFNSKTGTPFDSLKPNAPILSYSASTDQYFIQLGPTGAKMVVAATLAGQSVGNGQRYMVRIPVSDSTTGWSSAIYFAPLAWGGTSWTSSTASYYNSDTTPKFKQGTTTADLAALQSQNWMKQCSGCHITGVRNASVVKSEYVVNPYPAVLVPPNSPNYPDVDGDGQPDMVSIGCESCHGPGSAHILASGDPSMIVNPAKITNNQQRTTTCLQCHVQIASAPNKTWGFPYDEATNRPFVMTNPPDSLDKYQVFTGGKWPDGWNYVAARVDSFKSTDHFQGAHGIACNDCHDAHAETNNPAQVRDKITHGSAVVDLPVSTDNDSFCLSCHATHGIFQSITPAMVRDWDKNFPAIRTVIENHTHHSYAADRTMGVSNCITCHMAPTAGHGTIEGVNHTFMPARPEDTIALQKSPATGTSTYGATGNINSCSATCHRGKVMIWTDVPMNPTYNDVKFGTTNEVNLAKYLVKYFGPGGLWWDTKN